MANREEQRIGWKRPKNAVMGILSIGGIIAFTVWLWGAPKPYEPGPTRGLAVAVQVQPQGDMNLSAILNALSTVSGLVAVVLGLYVTVRLYRFKDELIKEINGTYLRTERFNDYAKFHEDTHDRVDREIDNLREWKHDLNNKLVPMFLRDKGGD